MGIDSWKAAYAARLHEQAGVPLSVAMEMAAEDDAFERGETPTEAADTEIDSWEDSE